MCAPALVICFLLRPMLAAPEPSAVDLMAAAEEARASGDLAGSLALVRRAHGLDPSPALLNNIGVLLEALGQYRAAIEAYRGVLEDPRTPPDVQARERERIDALTPRLAHAWLLVEPVAGLGHVYLDRAPVDPGEERALAPGRAAIEIVRAHSHDLWLHTVELRAGERHTLRPRFEASAEEAVISIAGIVPPLEALEVDAQLLRGVPPRVRVHLSPGAHHLRFRPYGDAWLEATVELAPGQLLMLAEHPTLAPRMPPPLTASPTATERSAWPAVWAGVSAAALAGSAVLFVAASSDRSTVLDADRDAQGVITGLSFARAGELEARADTRANLGAATLVLGASAAATALAWWLWESDALR